MISRPTRRTKLDEPATVQDSEEDDSKSDAQTTKHEAGEEKEEQAKLDEG